MGYFDAFTANLFRTDATGQRVMTPFGNRGGVYVVPDSAVPRITGAVKLYYMGMLVVIVTATETTGWKWGVFVVVVPLVAVNFIMFSWLVRPLQRLPIKPSELPKKTRVEAMQASAVAMGPITLTLVLLAALAMTAAAVYVRLWWGAAFFGSASALFIVQLWRLYCANSRGSSD